MGFVLFGGVFFDKVLAARDHVPHEYYKYFLESLLGTVRDGIAECSEVSTVLILTVTYLAACSQNLLWGLKMMGVEFAGW